MQKKKIPFSPPDISAKEIEEVTDTLKSGWITTGPKVCLFEQKIAEYCNTKNAICLYSATAGLEILLRLLEIKEGDEIITTPYTFAATANVILHTGAKVVFADIHKGGFNINPSEIDNKITEKTKAVITVDFAGCPVEYDKIIQVLEESKQKYNPAANTMQTLLDRPFLISDAAHSFGSSYKGKMVGGIADFTVFSFHAVKNLTTAEGGAITFTNFESAISEEISRNLKLLSLHGQSKDAFSKMKAGGWQYEIVTDGYKYNMTDISAAIGLGQLSRYENELLPKRKAIYEKYVSELSSEQRFILPPFSENDIRYNFHLFPLRIKGISEEQRNEIIKSAAEEGIALNVHFIPLPMHPLYKQLGYKISNYPNAYETFKQEISLPIYTKLSLEDVSRVCDFLKKAIH